MAVGYNRKNNKITYNKTNKTKTSTTSNSSKVSRNKMRTYKKSTVDSNLLGTYEEIAETIEKINNLKKTAQDYDAEEVKLAELRLKRDELKKISNEKLNKIYIKNTNELKKSLSLQEKLNETTNAQLKIMEAFEDISDRTSDYYEDQSSILEQILDINNDLLDREEAQIKTLKKKGLLFVEEIDILDKQHDLTELLLELDEKKINLSKKKNELAENEYKKLNEIIDRDIESLNITKEKLNLIEKINKANTKATKYGKRKEASIHKVGDLVTGGLSKIPGGSWINNRLGIGDWFKKKGTDIGTKAATGYKSGGMFGAMKSMGILATSFTALAGVVAILASSFGLLLSFIVGANSQLMAIKAGQDLSGDSIPGSQLSTVEKLSKSFDKDFGERLKITNDKIIEYTTALRESMDGIRTITSESDNKDMYNFVKTSSALMARLGISSEEMTSLHAASTLMEESMDKVLMTTHIFGDRIIGTKNAMVALSKVSKTLLANFKGTNKELIQSVVKAKMLGTNLEAFKSIGDTALDIESSLEKEMEFRIMTGMNLNMDYIRESAMLGRPDKIMDYLTTIMDDKKWKSMNVFGKKSLSDVTGMSEEDLSNLFTRQRQLKDLGWSQNKYEELMLKSRQELEEMAKNSSGTAQELLLRMASEKDTRTLDQRIADIISGLKDTIQVQFTALTGTINTLISVLNTLVSKISWIIDNLSFGSNTVGALSEKTKNSTNKLLTDKYNIPSSTLDSLSDTQKYDLVRKKNKEYERNRLKTRNIFGYNITEIPILNEIANWKYDLDGSFENKLNQHNKEVIEMRKKRGYASGKVNINGPGTTTSDSILARLSKGESVINAIGTSKNLNFLEYINEGGVISDLILKAAQIERRSNIETTVNTIANRQNGYVNSGNNTNDTAILVEAVNVLKQILAVASQPAIVKLGDTFVNEIDSRIKLKTGMQVNIDNTWGRTL